MATGHYSKLLSVLLSCFLLPFCIIGCAGGGQSQSTAPTAPTSPTQPTQPYQPPTADFSLSLAVNSIATDSDTIVAGTSAAVTLNVRDTDIDDDPITIAAPTLPAGISLEDKAGGGNVFPLAVLGGVQQALTFISVASTNPGTYPITFEGSDANGHNHSVTLSLTILAAPASPDFTIAGRRKHLRRECHHDSVRYA